MPCSLPGPGGQFQYRPSVVLIATHADKVGCHKNARGEYVSPVASSILAKVGACLCLHFIIDHLFYHHVCCLWFTVFWKFLVILLPGLIKRQSYVYNV